MNGTCATDLALAGFGFQQGGCAAWNPVPAAQVLKSHSNGIEIDKFLQRITFILLGMTLYVGCSRIILGYSPSFTSRWNATRVWKPNISLLQLWPISSWIKRLRFQFRKWRTDSRKTVQV